MDGTLVSRFTRSTIGLKMLMALTGIILFGFVVAHVSGNLLVFSGPEAMRHYAELLRLSMKALWTARLVLLGAVILHILSAVTLYRRRAEARPVPYGLKAPHGSTYAARTMIWSGPILAFFIVYHLLHFTVGLGALHPDFRHMDPYHNVVVAFQNKGVALAYIIAMVALGIHLSHGVWSMLQTIGVNRPNWEGALRRLAVLFGVAVCAGFIAVPAAVVLGFLPLK